MMQRLSANISHFFAKPIFRNEKFVLALWTCVPIIAWIMKLAPHKHNNYLIFSQSFFHFINGTPLYTTYPDEYYDIFLYGPPFTIFVAPFSALPTLLGLLAWLAMLSLTLFYTIKHLELSWNKRVFIYWFCAHELLTALFMSQFNTAIATIVIASFILVRKEKDCWAALLIVFGTLTKLYGIVGLAFILFSKHRIRFVAWCAVWAIVVAALPFLLNSPEYVSSQYYDWIDTLANKNDHNTFSLMTNISFLGMVRKISGIATYSDIWLILGGLALLALPYLRFGQYRHAAFQYMSLASMLLFVVLFSTGSESSTYIIAFTGVAIWYVAAPWRRGKADVWLMVAAFIITSMSPSDLFPRFLREEFVRPYAIKALPCFIIWLKLQYEMCRRDFAPSIG